MGFKEFNVVPINTGSQRQAAWQAKTLLNKSENGDWCLIPDNVNSVQVTVSFTNGASGKVQATTDLVEDIKNENDIIPVDWIWGEVEETLQDTCKPPSALRAVMIQNGNSGTMKMTLRGQV